jgi:hypothetical protein
MRSRLTRGRGESVDAVLGSAFGGMSEPGWREEDTDLAEASRVALEAGRRIDSLETTRRYPFRG